MQKFKKYDNFIFFGGLVLIILIALLITINPKCASPYDLPYTINTDYTNINAVSIASRFESEMPFDISSDGVFAIASVDDYWIGGNDWANCVQITYWYNDSNKFELTGYTNNYDDGNGFVNFYIYNDDNHTKAFQVWYNPTNSQWETSGHAPNNHVVLYQPYHIPFNVNGFSGLPSYPIYTQGDTYCNIENSQGGHNNNVWLFTGDMYSYPNIDDIINNIIEVGNIAAEIDPKNPSTAFASPNVSTTDGILQKIDNDINKQTNTNIAIGSTIAQKISDSTNALVEKLSSLDGHATDGNNKLDIIISKLNTIISNMNSDSPMDFIFDSDIFDEYLDNTLSGQLIKMPFTFISDIINGVKNGQAPDRIVFSAELPEQLGGYTFEFNFDWYPPYRNTVSNIALIFLAMGLYFRVLRTLPDILHGTTSETDKGGASND